MIKETFNTIGIGRILFYQYTKNNIMRVNVVCVCSILKEKDMKLINADRSEKVIKLVAQRNKLEIINMRIVVEYFSEIF